MYADIALFLQSERIAVSGESDRIAGAIVLSERFTPYLKCTLEILLVVKISYIIAKGNNHQTICVHIHAADLITMIIRNIFVAQGFSQLIRQVVVCLVAILPCFKRSSRSLKAYYNLNIVAFLNDLVRTNISIFITNKLLERKGQA